jgi:predicted GTPase
MTELAALAKKCVLPGMTVVVVGNTGAGKSSLLNALLNERGWRRGVAAHASRPLLHLQHEFHGVAVVSQSG